MIKTQTMNKQTEKFLELTQVEKERDAAVILLQKVLTDSDVQTPIDRDIARFLEEIGELPNNWLNYFEDDEE